MKENAKSSLPGIPTLLGLLSGLVAGLVALIGALRAIRIQPAESLREL